MVTPIGFFFAILALFYYIKEKEYGLFYVLVLSCVFQGASVLNIETLGFSAGLLPYYFISLLISAHFVIKLLVMPSFFVARIQFWRPFLLFCIISIVGSFLLPTIFNGTPVYAPRLGIDSQVGAETPLSWSFSNLAQSIYVVLNFFVLMSASSISWTGRRIRSMVSAMHIATLMAAAVAFYQYFCSMFGFDFPGWIFNSNIGGAQLFDNSFLGFARLSGTFSESSNLASHFVSYFAFIIILTMIDGLNFFRIAAVIFSVIILLISTSSTAYIGFLAAVVIAFFFQWLLPSVKRINVWIKISSAFFVIFSIIIIAALILEFGYYDVMYDATFNKFSSDSYVNRSASNYRALELVIETFGFGVGLGSNRPSSFFLWLLSNTGILGVTAYLFSYYKLISDSRIAAKKSQDYNCIKLNAAIIGAIILQFFVKLLSQPDLSFPSLWAWTLLLLALLIFTKRVRKNYHV